MIKIIGKFSLLALLGVLCWTAVATRPAAADPDYEGATFGTVWDEVTSDLYDELPQYEVSVSRMLGRWLWFPVNHAATAAKRTLATEDDIYPIGVKLFHANGVCLAGTWNMTEENPYTGYFRQGSTGLIVARVSTALTGTKQDEFRAFGLAGKIFPTEDPDHTDLVPTANFFSMPSVIGTQTDSVLDNAMENDNLKLAINEDLLNQFPALAVVFEAILEAEPSINLLQGTERQLYPISELGETDPSAANTPRWLKIEVAAGTPLSGDDDFRDELRMENYPDGLRFEVYVSDTPTRLQQKQWQRVGHIDFTESVASEGCDTRLHFHHPPFRYW